MGGASLAELLDEGAGREAGVERLEVDGGIAYRREGRGFAVLDPDGTAGFRLGPILAAAARRTPGVAPSERGPDWVRFDPPVLDRFARDRATSWFAAAYRRAEG